MKRQTSLGLSILSLALALGSVAFGGCSKKEPTDAQLADTKAADNKAAEAPKHKQLRNPIQESGMNDIPAPADVAAPPADAQKTATGLASKVLHPSESSEKPRAQDRVKVHYSGWTTDGKMFDSSVKRGTPAEFGLSQVIAGWTEGLQLMSKGEKRRIWIPEALAYQGRPGRPAGMLVFDVELIDISRMPDPPALPEDLAKPGAGAKTEKSGLISRVIKKGTGKVHPKATDMVRVHYSGWTQNDGKMFDSSVVRGEPAEFSLNGVIPGWTEGVQLMVEGETRRLWIPGKMAYDGQRGPQGVLVFDVELLAIQK